jgi:hypothetical protein
MISDGQSVQLATYAYSRSPDDTTFPAVAYLILSDAQLLTPSGSPVVGSDGGSAIAAPPIRTVWEQFSQAIEAGDGWLTAGDTVPARPLQSPSEWPRGAELVLDADLQDGDRQSVCRYCDYQRLCGLQETL